MERLVQVYSDFRSTLKTSSLRIRMYLVVLPWPPIIEVTSITLGSDEVFSQFWARCRLSISWQVLCAVLPKRGGPADSLPCFQLEDLQWRQVSLTVTVTLNLDKCPIVHGTLTTTKFYIWEEYIFWYQSILDFTSLHSHPGQFLRALANPGLHISKGVFSSRFVTWYHQAHTRTWRKLIIEDYAIY